MRKEEPRASPLAALGGTKKSRGPLIGDPGIRSGGAIRPVPDGDVRREPELRLHPHQQRHVKVKGQRTYPQERRPHEPQHSNYHGYRQLQEPFVHPFSSSSSRR